MSTITEPVEVDNWQLMRERFDDELPEPESLPKPEGWFELMCCSTVVLVFVVLLLVLGLTH